MLIEFGLMEQIFPVKVKHKEIRPTTYLTVALAQVLSDNEPTGDFKKFLVEEAKIPGDFVDITSILIEIIRDGITPENVYELYRKVSSKHVRQDILEELFKVMNFTAPEYSNFLKYRPSTNGKDVAKQGFRGARIGDEIRRIEGEKFLQL